MQSSMIKVVVIFFLFYSLTQAGFAEQVVTPSKRISVAFQKIEDQLEKHKTLGTVIGLSVGSTPKQVLKHYQQLFTDLSEATSSNGAGDHLGGRGKGYVGINSIINKRDLFLLKLQMPQALSWYKQKIQNGMNPSFNEWKSQFHGSSRLALLTVILSLGWVNSNLEEKYRTLIDYYSPYYDDFAGKYGVQPFSKDAFGLNLLPPYSVGMTGENFGRAYKTIAGMNLAFTLWNKGYSSQESYWAVKMASVTYEASDLLYDHLNRKSNESVSAISDAKTNFFRFTQQLSYDYNSLNTNYDQLLNDFRKKINSDSNFKKMALYSVLGLKDLDVISLDAIPIDVGSDFECTIALLAAFSTYPKTFYETFKSHFEGSNGVRLYKLINASREDTKDLSKGAQFTLKELESEWRMLPKANYHGRIQFLLSAAKKAKRVIQ